MARKKLARPATEKTQIKLSAATERTLVSYVNFASVSSAEFDVNVGFAHVVPMSGSVRIEGADAFVAPTAILSMSKNFAGIFTMVMLQNLLDAKILSGEAVQALVQAAVNKGDHGRKSVDAR